MSEPTRSNLVMDLCYARLALEAIRDLAPDLDTAKRMATLAVVELRKGEDPVPCSDHAPALDRLPPGTCRCRDCGAVFLVPAIAKCPTCASQHLSRRSPLQEDG